MQDLIGSQEKKLQLIKQSVSAVNAPQKLIASQPELLSLLVPPLSPPHPISMITNKYSREAPEEGAEEGRSSNVSPDVDFSRAEDFFQMETKIDERRDDTLLKLALKSPEGSFMEEAINRYALPTQRLAFIQCVTDPGAPIKSSTLVISGQQCIDNKEMLISCQVCGEMFNSLDKFQRHSLTHPDPENKKFLCQICGKRFNRADHLNRHAVLHGDIVHKCLLCGEEFDRASHLDRHRRKNHPPAGQQPIQLSPQSSPLSQSPLHSLSAPGSAGLEGSGSLGNNLHLLAAVATPEIYTDLTPEEVLQFEASKVVAQIIIADSNREEQEKKPPAAVERPYNCEMCGRKFIRATHLRRHMRIHTGEKPFSCHICGRRYARGDYLRAHINAHRRDKVHKCKHCSEVFYDLTRFANHCRAMHKEVEGEYGNVSTLSMCTEEPLSVAEGVCFSGNSSPSTMKNDEMVISTFPNPTNMTHSEFIPASITQPDTNIILQNGTVPVPETANEITIMSQPRFQSVLDPLSQFIISSTGAIEVAHMIPVDTTHS